MLHACSVRSNIGRERLETASGQGGVSVKGVSVGVPVRWCCSVKFDRHIHLKSIYISLRQLFDTAHAFQAHGSNERDLRNPNPCRRPVRRVYRAKATSRPRESRESRRRDHRVRRRRRRESPPVARARIESPSPTCAPRFSRAWLPPRRDHVCTHNTPTVKPPPHSLNSVKQRLDYVPGTL